MKKKIILSSIGVFLAMFLILFLALPTQATGEIKSCHVVEGVGYTLTVVLESGSEVKANFSGGQLQLGGRCELRRKHFLAKWEFSRYL